MGQPPRGRLGARQRRARGAAWRGSAWRAPPTITPSAASTTFTATAWRPTARSAWRPTPSSGRPAARATTRWSSSAGTGARCGGRGRRAAAAIPGPRRIRARAAASVRSPSPTTRARRRASSTRTASTIVMLPEPARLDARAHPELSWLRLPFFAGQPRVSGNPPLVDRFGGGKPPRQPARRREWNAIGSRPALVGLTDRRRPRRWRAHPRASWGLIPMVFLRSTPSLCLAGRTTRGP